jgi:hypothetical protein
MSQFGRKKINEEKLLCLSEISTSIYLRCSAKELRMIIEIYTEC